METFQVRFHDEDVLQFVTVKKLTEEEFNRATEGGTRHLFELETNFGFFVFFDGLDHHGEASYFVLHYVKDEEDPIGCYAFELKDYYHFLALYLNDLAFRDELEEENGEEAYGPIHHLAHLIEHIIEEGMEVDQLLEE